MNVNDLVAERIAAAAARRAAAKQRRERIEAARNAGLHYRHRTKLARLDQAQRQAQAEVLPRSQKNPEEITMHTPHPRRTKIGGNLYRPELPQDAIWAARQARGYSRSAYANPHPVGKPCKPCGGTVHDLDESLHLYGQYLDNNPQIVDQAAAEPTGARFACWCKLTQPCHLDQLLTRIGHREH